MRYGAQMCGLRLGRRSGPVSSPRVAFLGLAAALVIACGGGSGEPAATPPTETPGSTRSPVAAGGPVTPTPAPDAFAIEISEVEKAFVRLESAPGERIKETAGLFFLDVATGEVEGWQLLGQGSGWFQLFTSPRNRYVYAPDGPPRESPRTVVARSPYGPLLYLGSARAQAGALRGGARRGRRAADL